MKTAEIIYPDSDGLPTSDNTVQARWIFVIYGNLSALFADRDDVFIAADNLWYPVEGRPDLRQGPDVYVVFGRPKGDRGSYKQWLEGDVPLTAVFEIRSPGNSDKEMADKLAFYDEHGVEEYYVYDPDTNRLEVYLRRGTVLVRRRKPDGFVSPRLGITFDLGSGPEMVIRRPNGQPFITFTELMARFEAERLRADNEKSRADREQERANRLAVLSRKARRGLASAEELAELDRLEGEPNSP